jgi:hypothetical protein
MVVVKLAVAANIVDGYSVARWLVVDAGYQDDIALAEGLANVKPTAQYVLGESAWVIVNSGFRFQVARKLWPWITSAFHDFDMAQLDNRCVETALKVLNHRGKIQAIADLGALVRDRGHEWIVAMAANPLKLMTLPWIGKITCWHLAKVLGVDCVKPDVHLQRAATAAGYATPRELCEALRDATGDRLTVLDSVLWRYGEQQKARGWPAWSELWRIP